MREYGTIRHWILVSGVIMGLFGMVTHAIAGAFQIWEQDGASIANYHAGYAAED